MAVTNDMAITEFGLNYQKARVDAAAINIANANVVQPANGAGFKPLQVTLNTNFQSLVFNAEDIQTAPNQAIADKQVYKPEHPMADGNGFVRMTNVDVATQMISFTEATRAYEANVKAFNTQMNMTLTALEIGK